MILQLIPHSVARDTALRRVPLGRSAVEHSRPLHQDRCNASDSEEVFMFKLIACFFVLLVLPAVLAMLYVALNPDAFMMSITPATDLPDWSLGS